jgi:hypothetical protein
MKNKARIITFQLLQGLLMIAFSGFAQPRFELATTQLGFRPESPKTVTFWVKNPDKLKLPDQIPFYVTRVGGRIPRNPVPAQAKIWEPFPFRFPIDIDQGTYIKPIAGALYSGILIKKETAWGTFWQADFSEFNAEGIYQIENEFAFTVPFTIEKRLYERLERSFLVFLNNQRSGVDIPGVRPLLHADDAMLDTDNSFFPAAGGWYDAGDWRKWMALTQGNVEALSLLIKNGHPVFQQQALDELRWGNQYFQRMIADDGFVYEDVAGGVLRFGYTYEDGWWLENHPGCIANNSKDDTDGIPATGDERLVRVHYNPLVQFQFVRYQMTAMQILEPHEKGLCLYLAEKAWKYGQMHNQDRRTLFVAEELLAACELYAGKSKLVDKAKIESLVKELLSRQEINSSGLSGYFMEDKKADGYRSIAFACEPALALLRFFELDIAASNGLKELVKKSLLEFGHNFLLADAKNNIFSYTPYGVYVSPPYPEQQVFRKTGVDQRFVRSFIHLYAPKQMPHGTGGVLMAQAYFLAKAGKLFNQTAFHSQAEKMIQWTTGHNPANLCLALGVGFRHPVPANFVAYKIPEPMVVGFLGYANDSPYLEQSNVIEWSTQEQWDVPFAYTVCAIEWLK